MRKMKKVTAAITSAILAAVPVATAFTAPSAMADDSQYDNYAKLLQYSLYFFDANMCGDDVDESSAMEWRGNCHTTDEVVGGYHDAGDHAVFGLPQGYTAATLGWSYYEFKDAYDATGQSGHLKHITDRFAQFFKDSTILDGSGNVTRFLYQKGDGNVDHSYWGSPELQEPNRKMFWTTDNASDIAAEYAAGLAVNYINFGNAEDLKYAEALYKFSTKYNKVATDGPWGFYGNGDCRDEQAWAAAWLYKATGNGSYKSDMQSKRNQYPGWIHGWENVDLGVNCLYGEITGDWNGATGFIGGKTYSSDYLCLDKWGSARLNCSLQFTALVAQKHTGNNYASWCKDQMTYILGQNPTNTCFVTGFAPNSAANTHHRAASGYQKYDEQEKYDPVNGKVLIGALAGGPEDGAGTYADVMNNYVSNEVALDYNAALVGAAAGLYSVYGTGSVESSIVGVNKIYGSESIPDTPVITTTKAPTPTTTKAPETTTTKAPAPTTTKAPETTKAPVVTTAKPVPTGSKAYTLNDVKLGVTYDLSKYSDITRVDFIFDKTPANGMNGCAVFGNWELQNNYSANDLVNNTLTVVPDRDYSIMTIHKWYGDANLKSVIIYTGSVEEVTTQPTTTTAKPTTTTAKPTTTTTAKPTTTTAKPTTTTAKPTTTTAKPTTTTAKPTTTTAKPTTTTAKPTTTTAKPTTTTTKPTTTTTKPTTTTAKPTTTAAPTTTKPAETQPAGNTVVLKDVKYGQAYSLANYNYQNIKKIVIKLSGSVNYGFGGNLVLGDWAVQNGFDHTNMKADNTIEINVTNPMNKMTVFSYWGSMDLESVTLCY